MLLIMKNFYDRIGNNFMLHKNHLDKSFSCILKKIQ